VLPPLRKENEPRSGRLTQGRVCAPADFLVY
jgi:hypothetical protein